MGLAMPHGSTHREPLDDVLVGVLARLNDPFEEGRAQR